jgi:hypothetical protein
MLFVVLVLAALSLITVIGNEYSLLKGSWKMRGVQCQQSYTRRYTFFNDISKLVRLHSHLVAGDRFATSLTLEDPYEFAKCYN